VKIYPSDTQLTICFVQTQATRDVFVDAGSSNVYSDRAFADTSGRIVSVDTNRLTYVTARQHHVRTAASERV